MTPLLIVNPRSGGGKTGEVFDKMRRPIEGIVGPVDVAFTENPRHAVELARDAALNGREIVVAVGGDGSIHEVASGLMLARAQLPGNTLKTRLGIIGQGTGGDFRRTLGIAHRLDQYCKAIAGGHTKCIDIGKMSYADHSGNPQEGFFINILSMGLGGLVDQYVADMGRNLGGTMTYFVASVRGLIKSRIGQLKCTLSNSKTGAEPKEYTFQSRLLAVCNGRYFGSGMEAAPMALPDDGIFEVIDLGHAPKLKFFASSSRLYTGSHMNSPDVQHFQCDRIDVELLNPEAGDTFILDVDGEPLGRLPISIELIPKAIEVFVPASKS